MQFAAGPPSQWLVTLRSGAVIELAADSYTEQDGHALFSGARCRDVGRAQAMRTVDWPLVAPLVVVLLAKIPMTEVAEICGGWPWSKDLGD